MLLLCRADPNAFIEFVAGYTQAPLHKEMQQMLSDYRSCYIEVSRGHGKTNQFIYRDAWEIGHNPNILIKIVKSTKPEAVKHVNAVKSILESDLYRMVFPHVIPDYTNWGKQALTVKRTLLSKDPTIEASGIFGSPGGRSDIMRFDDVCTLKNSVQSPISREAVKEQARETWMPMRKPGSKTHRIGTPWHVNDLSADWRRNPNIQVLRRPCYGTDRSPWPERWTPEALQEERGEMGEIAYARAYLLQPITGDELIFSPERLLCAAYSVAALPSQGRIVCAIDMAFRTESQTVRTRRSNPDYSVATIARITDEGHVYPFRMIRVRTTFPKFKHMLMEAVKTHKVNYIITEEVGPLIGLNDQLAVDIKCPLRRMTRGNYDKYSRAVEVQSLFEQSRFHLPRKSEEEITDEFQPMFSELSDFPFGEHDDAADTAIDLMADANPKRLGSVHDRDPRTLNPYSVHDILLSAQMHKEKQNLLTQDGSRFDPYFNEDVPYVAG